MDWMVMNPQFHGTFASLGTQIGDTYTVNDDCLAKLCDILGKLTVEDRALQTFRRAMGFAQVVKKDLIPLLVGVRDDIKIINMTIKILLNLLVPVECLLPMDVMVKTEVGRFTVMELNMLLTTSKEAFVPPQSTRPVIDHMRGILEKECKLSSEDCESINNCLLLLRNILHIPEHRTSGSTVSMQNQILWNLFAQNFDKVLIQLMTSPYKAFWGVTVVQLIALMYKDQHVGTLQKLLNIWFESSLSDSSEGNESNTSPKHKESGDSSPVMTSDPTSDSSDNGTSNKKRSPYQTGDSKSVNNESDDSQSSATGVPLSLPAHPPHPLPSSASVSSDHQQQIQNRVPHPHPHPHPEKLRVKSLTELQGRSRRTEQHDDTGTENMDTVDSMNCQTSSQCSSWSQQSSTKPTSSSNGCPRSNQGHNLEAGSGSYDPLSKSHGQPQEAHRKPFNQRHESHCTHGKSHQSHCHGHSHASHGYSHGHSSHGHSHGHSHGMAHSLPTHSKAHGKKESGSEVSDCGYGTQQENQESNSTSSNEDDAPHRCMKHVKPQHKIQKSRYSTRKPNILPQEQKELHRKKLVKRSHTNTMHMKAILHHTPSEEDVSNLLKEFTVDFLLRGYGCLVKVLHHILLDDGPVQMDTSHFFWLVTYFLKFATQLELDLEHISSILTIDMVSYLTYEGVNLYEEFELGMQCSGRDLKPCLRRMHLVVTSIREFTQAVEAYLKLTHLSEEDRSHLLKLQLQIAEVRDLPGLFVLLLRQFNPTYQSQQFLRDLVVTNHHLLLFVENASKLPGFHPKTNLVQHLKQFGTVEVMRNYGLLLQGFSDNGEFVNDCVLTMMHHVAGDLALVNALFQPSILRALSSIWESDYEICDDWSDLIEYVIHKFMNNPSGNQTNSSLRLIEAKEASPSGYENSKTGWTKEDSTNLYWYYQQCCSSTDPIGAVLSSYKNSGDQRKTRIEVIQQLLLQDVINKPQFKSYLENETMLILSEKREAFANVAQTSAGQDLGKNSGGSAVNESDTKSKDGDEPANEIKALKDQLTQEGYGKVVSWLQELLLEVCYVKLCLIHKLPAVMEPVAHIYTRLRQSTPAVPWNAEQQACLENPAFILLMHKLGLHLPADAAKLFPRIPHFWSADVLYNKALKLGNVTNDMLKFDVSLIESSVLETGNFLSPSPIVRMADQEMEDITRIRNSSYPLGCGSSNFLTPRSMPKMSFLPRVIPAPITSSVPNWLQVVQQSKAKTSSLSTPVDSSADAKDMRSENRSTFKIPTHTLSSAPQEFLGGSKGYTYPALTSPSNKMNLKASWPGSSTCALALPLPLPGLARAAPTAMDISSDESQSQSPSRVKNLGSTYIPLLMETSCKTTSSDMDVPST